MTRASDDSGFTVVELLIALTLTMLLFFATLQVDEAMMRQSRNTDAAVDAAQRSRSAADQIARELRDATGWSATGTTAPALLRAAPSDLVYTRVRPEATATTAEPRPLERVRFCVETAAGVVWEQRGATASVPAAACPDPSWTRRAVVRGFAGTAADPLFEFDASAGADVRRVGIRMAVDDDPAHEPAVSVVRTAVELRNSNRPPLAAFTAAVGPGRHVLLNASTAQDPEAQLLTFTWRDDATQLADQGPVIDYVAPAAGTHTISLTVTDPGALSSSVSKTVTVLP